MSTPTDIRIALCVPAYNAARTLPRLFASAAAQTTPFDEIWVYDDASSDDTAAVAERAGARVVRGTTNVGCSGGKNALLERIGCNWVHFHDADDVLHPEFVERARRRISTGDFDVLLFDYEQCHEVSGEVIARSNFAGTKVLTDPIRYMLRYTVNNGGVYSVALLRKLGGFDLDLAVRFNEDRAFHLRLAERGARFAHEPYVGSRFYFSPGSMSAGNPARCNVSSFEITKRFAERHPGAYGDEIASMAWHDAGVLASYLEWAAADGCVDLAVRARGKLPAQADPLFKLLCAVDGKLALRIREHAIRLFKPALRRRPADGARHG